MLLLGTLVVMLVAAPLLARGYRALCYGRVDAYVALESARGAAARAETPAGGATGSVGTSLAALARGAVAGGLAAFLNLKQSDPVAYPAHAAAGAVLEAGRCETASILDQWTKSAKHAAWAPAADVTAAALLRVSGGPPEAIVATLRRMADDEPWFEANIRGVERALERARAAAGP